MRGRLGTIGLLVAAAGLVLGLVACSSSKKSSPGATATSTKTVGGGTPSGSASKVAATLLEYKIQAQPASVPAGAVTFNIKNAGSAEHELVVLKTALAPNALPSKADGSANEDGAGVTSVDEAESMAAGDLRDLTVNLEPGTYVLLCNIVQTVNGQTISHYKEGMAIAFEVTQ